MQKYLYEDLYLQEEIHWWHRSKRELVCQILKGNISKKSNILDIGCGTGKNIESFSRFGKIWGVDSSIDAIKFCKKRGLKNVKKGSIEKIPFRSKSLDAVTALDVLEHVEDSKALKEIHRVLKDYGVLIITVPAFPHLWSRWDEVLHHKRRYTRNSLQRVLNQNGFEVSKISYLYSFLYIPAFLIRKIKELFYKKHYPSDFKLSSNIINLSLYNLSSLERFFAVKINIPFGTSLIAVAKKVNQ